MSRSRAGTVTVRVLFASFPLWSLGVLAWVPSLRIAVLRRRPRDWAAAIGFMALTVLYLVMLEAVPEEDENLSALAGVGIVLFLAGTVTHAVLADRFPRGDAAPAPGGVPHPGPYPYAAPHHPHAAPVARARTHAAAPGHVPAAGPAPAAGGTPPAGTPAGGIPGGPAPAGPGGPHPRPGTPPVGGPGTPPAGGHPGPHGSSPRIRQAVSELDELGDLLRGEEPGR